MNIPWRVLLPFGHLAVDCVVLALWLWHADTLYRPRSDSVRPRVEQALFFQGEGSVAFEPKFFSPQPEFLFLTSGNLPALLVSLAVRPEALGLTPAKPWDPVWFSIHEAVSSLFWFAVGVLLDRRLRRIGKLMVAYLMVRFGFAAFLLVHGVADIGWRVEVLAWWAFVVYGIVVALRWILSRRWRARVD
jgi:hypothetical protein